MCREVLAGCCGGGCWQGADGLLVKVCCVAGVCARRWGVRWAALLQQCTPAEGMSEGMSEGGLFVVCGVHQRGVVHNAASRGQRTHCMLS